MSSCIVCGAIPGQGQGQGTCPCPWMCGSSALGKQLLDPCWIRVCLRGSTQLRSGANASRVSRWDLPRAGVTVGQIPLQEFPASRSQPLLQHGDIWDQGAFAPPLGAALPFPLGFGNLHGSKVCSKPQAPNSQISLQQPPETLTAILGSTPSSSSPKSRFPD